MFNKIILFIMIHKRGLVGMLGCDSIPCPKVYLPLCALIKNLKVMWILKTKVTTLLMLQVGIYKITITIKKIFQVARKVID